jgi:hypothetical protein
MMVRARHEGKKRARDYGHLYVFFVCFLVEITFVLLRSAVPCFLPVAHALRFVLPYFANNFAK